MINPFSHPVYVMPKPIGATCNLACEYCYYLEKRRLYDTAKATRMSDETLEEFVKQYIAAQTTNEVMFTWHGGEPTLMPIDFYKRAIELQQKYGKGKRIENCLQTNGTLLNDEWCRFFRDNNWLIGLSIDGGEEFHDEYRRTRTDKPTFRNVMKGVRLLQKYGVEWNAMAVVNEYNADYPVEFYNFFKRIGCRYIQFTPVVERLRPDSTLAPGSEAGGVLAPFSVSPEQWGNFLCGVFDEWIKKDVGEVFVQIFDATLANWAGKEPGLCTLSTSCGHAAAMEHNGDVYSCDHFVFPEHKIGNIHDSTIIELMNSERQQRFGASKLGMLPTQCRKCEYKFACNGECPRNRFAISDNGEGGLNYLCEGYRKFFSHVAPYMDFMKRELEAERAPANVMLHLKELGSER